MHDCPSCGQACDCDGEDTWTDRNSLDCVCQCDDDEPDDDWFDDDDPMADVARDLEVRG